MKEILAPLVFLALFLGIVGTALFLTPRLAAWLDRKRLMSKGPYADMMEAPAAPAGEKGGDAASGGTDPAGNAGEAGETVRPGEPGSAPADKTAVSGQSAPAEEAGGPEEEGEKNGH